jgi:hypothetical protein
MPNPRFVFKQDIDTGIPRLVDVEGVLGEDELHPWEDSLNRNYEDLLRGGDGREYEFGEPLPGRSLPTRYRVTVHRDEGTRCPALTFTLPEIADEAATPPESDPGDWRSGLVKEVGPAFGEERGRDPADQAGLSFVLSELATLARDHPSQLTLLLFAGYLALAERMSREHDLEKRGLYLLAARALEREHGMGLPEGTLNVTAAVSSRDPLPPTQDHLSWSSRRLSLLLQQR